MTFGLWWCLTITVLGVATWTALRSGPRVAPDQIGFFFLLGIAASLTMYLLPDGLAGARSLEGFQLRFFLALGVPWLGALCALPGDDADGYPTLALAGFAGVNAPLLFLIASSVMVCGGGQPSCAL